MSSDAEGSSMSKLKLKILSGTVMAVTIIGGCAARVKMVANLPPGITSTEVVSWDAAVANLQRIAAATNGARQSVISLNRSGAFPDGPQYAAALSGIAKIDQAQIIAARFLETVPNNWGRGTQQTVTNYIAAIQAAVQEITDTGLAGIKDQNQRNTVEAFTREIAAAANLILGLVSAPPASSMRMPSDRIRADGSCASFRLCRDASRIAASSVLA